MKRKIISCLAVVLFSIMAGLSLSSTQENKQNIGKIEIEKTKQGIRVTIVNFPQWDEKLFKVKWRITTANKGVDLSIYFSKPETQIIKGKVAITTFIQIAKFWADYVEFDFIYLFSGKKYGLIRESPVSEKYYLVSSIT